jgi:hypothetical protein
VKPRLLRFLAGLSIASSLMFILSNIAAINDVMKANIPNKFPIYLEAIIYLVLLIVDLIVAFQLWEKAKKRLK